MTFIDINGIKVATHTATYTANGSITVHLPGRDRRRRRQPDGLAGLGVRRRRVGARPDDRHLRSGLTVRVEVNPTATGQVAYPPETSACASPPDSSTTAARCRPPGANGGIAWAAGIALLLGVGALGSSSPTCLILNPPR